MFLKFDHRDWCPTPPASSEYLLTSHGAKVLHKFLGEILKKFIILFFLRKIADMVVISWPQGNTYNSQLYLNCFKNTDDLDLSQTN